jgi:uracil-DNA glycosylase
MALGSDRAFQQLVREAQACRCCPQMEGRRRVLSDLNGPPSAKVMFIAEAPGRLGGEITGRPLVDDASGRHFTALLDEAEINRDQIFISNAVLCNPQNVEGRNRKPARVEIDQCRTWLRRQIEVIDPHVVVSLGGTALAALSSIEEHPARLRESVRTPFEWYGRTLIPLYHPSPLTRASRSDAEQAQDYRWLGDYLRGRGLISMQRIDPIPTG